MMNHEILLGDALTKLRIMPDRSVDMCLTSPPYFGLRDYQTEGQIGMGQTVAQYVEALVCVFREVRRVLRSTGTLWLNLGDTYCSANHGAYNSVAYISHKTAQGVLSRRMDGFRQGELLGIPWRVAFALRDDGWLLRQDIIWHKPNAMPEPVRNRCVKAHEYIFLMAKQRNYYFNAAANREPRAHPSRPLRNRCTGRCGNGKIADGKRNRRDVWSINTRKSTAAHFAAYPEELAAACICAGCPEDGIVLDPFMGTGTTAVAAMRLNRRFVGVELNPAYVQIAEQRIRKEVLL